MELDYCITPNFRGFEIFLNFAETIFADDTPNVYNDAKLFAR